MNACILDSSLAVCVVSPRAIRVVLCSIISTCMLKCNMKEHYQHVHCEVCAFRRDVCNKSFAFQLNWKRHKIMRTDERPCRCDVRNVLFRNLKAVKEHMFRHNEYPYSCSLCGKGFSFQRDLTIPDHVLTGERPYVYNVCDKSFAQKFALNKQQCVHIGERSYNSDVCSESFHNKITLNANKVIHTEERPFGCGACYKSFGCRKHLSSHISLCCVKRL